MKHRGRQVGRELCFVAACGAPNGEPPLGGAADENAKLLKRKRLAKYAAEESHHKPTDEEFMGTGFGEVSQVVLRHREAGCW